MDKLTFYFDRAVGKSLPEALGRADPPFTVEYHHSPKNRFPQNITDDEWLTIVGKAGWLAFSHDRKWHKNTAELLAIMQHKIGCFYLWGAQALTWDKVCFIVRHHGIISDLARNTPRPFIFHVQKNGTFEQVDLNAALVAAGVVAPQASSSSGQLRS